MVLCRWKPSGTVASARPTCFRALVGTAVSPRRSPSGAFANPVQRPSSQSARLGRCDLAASNSSSSSLLNARDHRLHIGLGQRAFGDQLGRIELQRGRMILDRPVHQRLGEGRLVGLVVAEAAIADHVDHDVLVEQLAEFGGDARAMHHRFRIVAIHMEDRRLHHQRHVGGIGRGARVDRRGGEADLVVDDEMDGAAGAETLGAGHGETFRHHALAGEGGIAVDQQRQHAGARVACRPADTAWRAPCPAPPDRRLPDARGWR